MKLLFFGDIVARAGRQALSEVLPHWREIYEPDIIIGCVDNLAHGKGATEKTLAELLSLGFAGFTTGDHVLNSPTGLALVGDARWPMVRPLNVLESTPGVGARRLPLPDGHELLLVHLMGQVFTPGEFTSPFAAVTEVLAAETARDNLGGVVVDIHAEATSEKVALGWYLNGQVTAVLGTHTHIPTRDEWVLPRGTAYVTDVGMTGVRESVLGVEKDIILRRFTEGGLERFEPAEHGTVIVTAVLVTFDALSGRASAIERLSQEVVVG
ncbi:MAG: TIGR00282 family metallophosphoesterase [Candidatus Veblenbacteria bacterium]|nr:TIGR00282 family metallophosphoesterase [Candidatus Veblenbacteria bacterium]MDZ4229560.1 TIGR00282 family metallophosphoesterase [Candidatus Veblenbacteria bacterium]